MLLLAAALVAAQPGVQLPTTDKCESPCSASEPFNESAQGGGALKASQSCAGFIQVVAFGATTDKCESCM